MIRGLVRTNKHMGEQREGLNFTNPEEHVIKGAPR